MAWSVITLVAVCLCFISPIYAQTFSLSYTNISSVGDAALFTITLVGYQATSGPIELTVTVTPSNVISFDFPYAVFSGDESFTMKAIGLRVGAVSLTLSANTTNYALPAAQTVFVFLNAMLDGDKELYPGTTVQGVVSLDSSPSQQVIATLSSSPSVSLSPSQFTFNSGASPYNQIFTISCTQPGTYFITLTLSGPDFNLGYTNSVANVTLVVENRLVYARGPSYLSLDVGVVSSPILIFLDVAPDVGLTLAINTSNPNLVANPSTLIFTPGSFSATFTVSGEAAGSFLLSYSLGGADQSKYSLDLNSTYVSTANRTVVVPTSLPSLVVGVPSSLLTAYIATPPSQPLVVTPWGPNLTFTPTTLNFGPSDLVVLFTVTASPGALANAMVSYSISGLNSAWYSVPAPSAVSVTSFLRNVNPVFTVSLNTFPVDVAVPANLTLDLPTPSSFTIQLRGANIAFTPSSFTFQNAAGTLEQTFVARASALGSSRIYFTVTGADAALVAPIDSLAVTVVPRLSPAISFSSGIFVGTSNVGQVTLPAPVTSSLTISLSATPTNGATFTPSVITLLPSVEVFEFSVVAASIGPLRLHAVLSGPDANFFGDVADFDVDVTPIAVTIQTTIADLVVGVPFDGIVVTLSQATANPVVVTPYSALLQFDPPTLTFQAQSTQLCLSATPLVATTEGSVILFTVDDTENFIAPSPLSLPSISLRTISIDTSPFANPLVVGLPSQPSLVTLSVPPSSTIILTPGSSALTFNPPSLTFSSDSSALSFTVTAASLDAQGAAITWVVSGDDAGYYEAPEQILGVAVTKRSIFVPSSIDTAVVGYPSKPFLVTTDFAPLAGLTVTPTAPGLAFFPPSVQLSPGSGFAAFTATLASWLPVEGDPFEQAFTVEYAVSGPDAASYDLGFATTPFYVRQRNITVAPPTSIQYDVPSSLYSLVLETAPSDNLTITLCAPAMIALQPSTLVFGPGETSLQFAILASSADVSASAPTNVAVSWQLSGPSAVFYVAPNSFTIALSTYNTIILEQFPNFLTIGSAAVFELAVPNLNFAFGSLTVTPSAAALTFTPAQVTFSPTRLRFYMSVAADIPLMVSSTDFDDVAAFVLSGPDALLFSAPSVQIVSISKQYIGINYPELVTVGSAMLGNIILSSPPTTSLVLSAVFSPGLSIVPGQFTFGPTETVGNFRIFATTTAPTWVEWDVSGADAGFYDSPDGVDYDSIAFRTVYGAGLVQISPDDTSPEIIVTLSDPPVHGLTVTPILPPGFSSSRVLYFGPGQATLGFNLHTSSSADTEPSGYFQVPFAVSGPDSDWYQSTDILQVTITPGAFYVTLDAIVVGIPSLFEVSIAVTPPSGVTLTPSAVGVLFDPPQLNFSQNALIGKLTVTPLFVGTVVVYWSVSGPDAWIYQTPDPSATISQAREFFLQLADDTLTVGVPYSATLYTSYPPPTSVTLSLLASCLTVYPSPALTFTPTVATLQVTYTPSFACLSAGALSVSLSGPDAGWYTPPFTDPVPFYVSLRSVYIVGPSTVVSGMSAQGFRATLEIPGNITLVPSAAGCSFSPSQLAFSAAISSLPFTVFCEGIASYTTSITIPFLFDALGGDADLYIASTISVELYPNVIWVPNGPIEITSGTPYTYSISLSYLPANPVTLTPYSPTFTFSPPSITFSNSLYATLTVTATTPSGYSLYVFYNVTGQDSDAFGLYSPFTEFYSVPGTFTHPLGYYDLAVGTKSDVLTVFADPPTHDVALTPSAPGCSFVPPSLLFSPFVPTATVTFSCAEPGTLWVQFAVSGTDAEHYSIPFPVEIFIAQRQVTPSLGSVVTVFQPNQGSVSLDTPTELGLTVTPSGPGLTFSPPSFAIPPGGSYFAFSFVAVQVTSGETTPVTWSLSGADANRYDPPAEVDLYVLSKQVQVIPDYSAFTGTSLMVGTPTKVFVITLDNPPEVQLTVTPYGAGLTFNPSSLNFTPGVTGLPFTIQASVDGVALTVYYNLSGWDAPFYLVEPFTSVITTELLQLVLSYNDDVTVGVPSEPAVLISSNTPSAGVTLQFSGSGVTFSPNSVTLGPTADSALFRFTALAVGAGSFGVIISGDGASDFVRTIWTFEFNSNPRTFLVPSNLPDLFAGVSSSSISIGLENPPPTLITLTPYAPNVVFSPPSLTFTPTIRHSEFRATTASPAEQNQLSSLSYFQHYVTWQVGGQDAALYAPPSPFAFYALPRDLTIVSPFLSSVYLNVPQVLYVTTTYAPLTNLTIIPRGAFLFDPPVITLLAGASSASFTVTPVVEGSFDVRFSLDGPDAVLYQALGQINFVVQKWSFDMPDFAGAFQYGIWNAPLVVRPNIVPPNNVTLTLASDYLDFYPATLHFSNAAPSATFTFQLKGLGYSRTTDFEVTFWVGGVDAALFVTPGAVSFPWTPTAVRDLTISNFPTTLIVGVASAPIIVSIPYHPLGELVLTPYATSTDVVFSPTSLLINRTSTSLTASFTMTANHPTSTITVNIALNGTDANYYSAGFGFPVQVTKRSFILPIFPSLVVGLTSQPLAVALAHPTPTRVTLSFSSPSISFEPSVLTFLPNQSSVPLILTGYTVGNFVPVTVWVGGEDADWHDVTSPGTIQIITRTWGNLPETVTVTPGQPSTVLYTLSVPPNSYITLTPYAAGITFSPTTMNISAPYSSGLFTLRGNMGGSYSTVITTVGGPDALLYPPLPQYQALVSFLSVEIAVGLDENTMVDLGETNAVVFQVTAPPQNGLYVTPSASGLVFTPPSLYFAPGVYYTHATFTATTPGDTQVTYALSGPDRLLYQITSSLATTVSVAPLSFAVAEVGQLIVGSMSSAVPILSVGSNNNQLPPPLSVTVNFVISPPGAVVVLPSNVTLAAPASAFEVQFQANILSSSLLVVQPVLSGPGAAYYVAPAPITLTSVRRDFIINNFTNFLVNPAAYQLAIGVEAGPFGVTARSVPTDVSLILSGPGLTFIPSVLRFTGTYETLYFNVYPTQAIQTYVSFAVGGTDAALFDVPPISPLIRVTHNFIIPPLPALVVGQQSDPITIYVTSPITSPVILEPSAECITFNPPYLLFTPDMSRQSFTFVGNCVNYNLGENINPVITQDAVDRYANPPAFTSVSWNVREAGEQLPYVLSLPQMGGTQAVNIMPATFNVTFSKLTIGSTNSHVNISLTAPPRSDVVLTLIANNLNFNPPFATFTPGTAYQVLAVYTVHSDYKDSQNIPFVVDYIVSGSNWADYIPPAQTYLGVQQGAAPVVGAICRSTAAAAPVAMGVWGLVLVVMVIVW